MIEQRCMSLRHHIDLNIESLFRRTRRRSGTLLLASCLMPGGFFHLFWEPQWRQITDRVEFSPVARLDLNTASEEGTLRCKFRKMKAAGAREFPRCRNPTDGPQTRAESTPRQRNPLVYKYDYSSDSLQSD